MIEKKFYSRCPSSMIYEFFFSFVFSLHSIIRYSNYYAFIYNQGHMRTMKSLAWRDFKGRKPFDSLRQMMHVALVFTIEITGYMMFVDVEGFYEAFEHCHYSLYIQLNTFLYQQLHTLYRGTYLSRNGKETEISNWPIPIFF